MRFLELDAWLSWLETLHPKSIELGLDRVSAVARALGVDSLQATTITVAGTNGKGSVVAALQVLLQEPHEACALPRVGVYTSPHLQRFNERVMIDGGEASDESLCAAFEAVDRARFTANVAQDEPVSLSYFEFTTLAALLLFREARLDYIILEVGLGGRLDAVNIITPDVAVITHIGIDHESWLGHTRDQIAREKAGILRAGGTAVIGDPNPPPALVAIAEKLEACVYWAEGFKANTIDCAAGGEKSSSHGFSLYEGSLHWRGKGLDGESFEIASLPDPVLAPRNWSSALQVAVLLNALPKPASLKDMLSNTTLLGRQSRHTFAGREVILDVAHNSDAVQRLADILLGQKEACSSEGAEAVHASGEKIVMVFAALADKRVDEMIDQLVPCADAWIFAQLAECPRALEAGKMWQLLQENQSASHAHKANAVIAGTVAEAMGIAFAQATKFDKIVVCGSFYTVCEALDYMASPSSLGR